MAADSADRMCPELGECAVYRSLKNYIFSWDGYNHCTSFVHPLPFCRHGVECHAHVRLRQGGYRLDDLCHCAVYFHGRPNRCWIAAHDFGPGMWHRGSTIPVLCGVRDFTQLTSPEADAYHSLISRLQTSDEVSLLMAEIEANGFGYVLHIPADGQTEFSTLLQVAQHKRTHPRFLELGRDVKDVHLLALLVYTGTDAQVPGSLRENGWILWAVRMCWVRPFLSCMLSPSAE